MTQDALTTMPDAVRSSEVLTDEHIGRYRIRKRIDVNDTSEIVLATAEGALGFERTVVIKRLLPHASADPKRAANFGHEATAYARLTHPAIVRLYDFLTVNGMPAMVLEHVEGLSLERLVADLHLRGESLPVEAIFYIGARIFAALSAAHTAHDPTTRALSPVVHRDVSPANVLINATGDVKLSNFGFAKLAGTAATDTSLDPPKGTLGYMAPEQLLGDSITPRTDVYLGALLLRELLTGKPAFVRGEEPFVDYLQSMAMPELPPLATLRPGLPASVVDAIENALEPSSAKRQLTAADMHRVLNAHREGGRAKLKDALMRLGVVAMGTDAESDVDAADDSSITVPSVLRLEKRARRARIVAVACAACAAVFALIALRTSIQVARGGTMPTPDARMLAARTGGATSAQVQAAPVQALPTPAPVQALPTPRAAPTAAADPVQLELGADTSPSEGELRVLASTPAHRVFIDGRFAGHTGATFALRCGTHGVRIGGGGRLRTVTIPCGGATEVASR